jgi:hypothetical protein
MNKGRQKSTCNDCLTSMLAIVMGEKSCTLNCKIHDCVNLIPTVQCCYLSCSTSRNVHLDMTLKTGNLVSRPEKGPHWFSSPFKAALDRLHTFWNRAMWADGPPNAVHPSKAHCLNKSQSEASISPSLEGTSCWLPFGPVGADPSPSVGPGAPGPDAPPTPATSNDGSYHKKHYPPHRLESGGFRLME